MGQKKVNKNYHKTEFTLCKSLANCLLMEWPVDVTQSYLFSSPSSSK